MAAHWPALAQQGRGVQASDPPGIEGKWSGSVVLPSGELPFSVTFASEGSTLSATLDIPSQSALGLPLTEVSYEDGRVHFEFAAPIGLAVWDGVHEGDEIKGSFTQGAADGEFSVERVATEGPSAEEGAEEGAEQDIPYLEEEISFENGEVRLAGTLTVPEDGQGSFPAVVMITGSGPQNRDEELLGFPVFRVIADHLARRGIASLRYDDRGVGGSSGDLAGSTAPDLADDALAGIARLAEHPRIDPLQIGLLGHSEGASVAALAAARSDAVRFAALLAGPSVLGAEVIYEQSAAVARAGGAGQDQIEWTTDFQKRLFAAMRDGDDLESYRDELGGAIRDGIERLSEAQRAPIADVDGYVRFQTDQQIDALLVPWFQYFLGHNPADDLRQVRVPVLALFGELDLQVLPAQNRGPMEEALAANPDATVVVVPRANHLFQAATTGSPAEYALLEKAFADGFLDTISEWILERYGS